MSIFVFYRLDQRLKNDPAYARRLMAPATAKKGLDAARRLMQEGKPTEFYDSLFRMLQEYIGQKFHRSAAGITFAAIEDLLKKRGAPSGMAERLKLFFADCEMVRYAGVIPDVNRMSGHYRVIGELIDFLERNGK